MDHQKEMNSKIAWICDSVISEIPVLTVVLYCIAQKFQLIVEKSDKFDKIMAFDSSVFPTKILHLENVWHCIVLLLIFMSIISASSNFMPPWERSTE